MDENDYFQSQEGAAIGKALDAAVRRIFAEYNAKSLSGLQRSVNTLSDMSVGFRIFDGSYIGKDDERAKDPASISWVEDIEIDGAWLDLPGIADGSHSDCEKYPDASIEDLAMRRWEDEMKWAAEFAEEEMKGDDEVMLDRKQQLEDELKGWGLT